MIWSKNWQWSRQKYVNWIIESFKNAKITFQLSKTTNFIDCINTYISSKKWNTLMKTIFFCEIFIVQYSHASLMHMWWINESKIWRVQYEWNIRINNVRVFRFFSIKNKHSNWFCFFESTKIQRNVLRRIDMLIEFYDVKFFFDENINKNKFFSTNSQNANVDARIKTLLNVWKINWIKIMQNENDVASIFSRQTSSKRLKNNVEQKISKINKIVVKKISNIKNDSNVKKNSNVKENSSNNLKWWFFYLYFIEFKRSWNFMRILSMMTRLRDI